MPVGIQLECWVTALTILGEGEPSNAVTATPIEPPMQPFLMDFSQSSASVRLVWDISFDGGSPITEYRIYRMAFSDDFLQIGTVEVTDPDDYSYTYSDLAVQLGTSNWYRVTAVNAAGESEPSGTVMTQFTPFEWPPPPDDVGYGGRSAEPRSLWLRERVGAPPAPPTGRGRPPAVHAS